MERTPRTYLYVPADRPGLVARAAERGSDALILDLEDGIARENHEQARELVVAQLRAPAEVGPQVWVRLGPEDVADPGPLLAAGARRLVVPKLSEDVLDDLADAAGPGLEVLGLVETAAGLVALARLAGHRSVVRLGLGAADLAAELGLGPDGVDERLAPARFQLVVASAAAGLPAPVGPTSLVLDDPAAVERSTRRLAAEGFGARTCVHPSQVPPVHVGLAPTTDELHRAREVLAVLDGDGAGTSGAGRSTDGLMVDEAVARAARATLARAGGQPTEPSRRSDSTSSGE